MSSGEISSCQGRPASKSPIQSLPLLALTKIFKLLPNSDRECCTLVCHQWRDIITTEVGLTRFIGNGTNFNFPGQKFVSWQPVDVLRKVGIDRCVFGELLLTDQQERDDDINQEGFLLPELLQEVSFYGQISSELFHVIMSPVYWLNTLKLHLAVFLNASFDSCTWSLPSLQRLDVIYTHPVFHLQCPFTSGIKGENDEISGKDLVHKNLTTFLHTFFLRRLKRFEFVGPYFVDKSESLIDAVRIFVMKHEETLQELVVRFPYEWNVVDEPSGKRDSPPTAPTVSHTNSKEATAGADNESRGDVNKKLNTTDWGDVQLKRLVVVCPTTIVPPVHVAPEEESNDGTAGQREQAVSAWSRKILNETWEALLGKQCHLEFLQYINKYADWQFPSVMFSNNATRLTVICTCVNSEFHVNCQAFGKCENLAKLTLEGNFFCADEMPADDVDLPEADEKEGISRLHNVHCLPRSIKEICLSKVMIMSADLDCVADPEVNMFPNLRSFQLYQVGRGFPQFGLSTTAVQHLFDQSNLSLSLWKSLNARSFKEAIEKSSENIIDRDVETLKKMLEHCDASDGINEDLRFQTLNECHVQRIVRKGKSNSCKGIGECQMQW